jgi:hypothetical protein
MRFFIPYILIAASYALAIALPEPGACDLIRREVDCVDYDPQAYFVCVTRLCVDPTNTLCHAREVFHRRKWHADSFPHQSSDDCASPIYDTVDFRFSPTV